MEDCIFCKIVKGDIPSYTIYENDNIKVFMDIGPVAKGHSLIIPKKHYTNLMDMEPELLREIDEVIKELYPKFKEKLAAEGLTRMQNNELGQEVKHYHMHLIPRYKNDKLEPAVNEEAKENVAKVFELLK
ncbi:MAG: HIT domain-containing protein [Clostridia bacterium]|nr:HIT domain-containing protein [Clostridia bacterium]